ncbi:hypothetical protein KDK_71180 [Dictyobacter kobayashii]|uniref:Uncharacterized protein n=1 Tax=Dictyobacter kobayashii TaxID=2014872 RepID=A0A402AW42_9CHLR|nr:hypothetical protein KDK_71180 [Dictyobacter kobayashii]
MLLLFNLRVRVRVRRCVRTRTRTRTRKLSSNLYKNTFLIHQKAFFRPMEMCYNARGYASFIVEELRIRRCTRIRIRVRRYAKER